MNSNELANGYLVTTECLRMISTECLKKGNCLQFYNNRGLFLIYTSKGVIHQFI